MKMTTAIQALFHCAPTESIGIATVTEAVAGQAVTIDLSGEAACVAGHLGQTEYLIVGDRVLTLRTVAGIIVIGRLRAADEAPAPRMEQRGGRLRVQAPESVCLQAGENRIEVHADGRIALDGKQITGQASGPVRLLGSTIELN
jgi:hypothetical protein